MQKLSENGIEHLRFKSHLRVSLYLKLSWCNPKATILHFSSDPALSIALCQPSLTMAAPWLLSAKFKSQTIHLTPHSSWRIPVWCPILNLFGTLNPLYPTFLKLEASTHVFHSKETEVKFLNRRASIQLVKELPLKEMNLKKRKNLINNRVILSRLGRGCHLLQ